MDFIKILFSFIDNLQSTDIACMVVLYAIFSLFLINLLTKFSFINFAEYTHIAIFTYAIFSSVGIYFLDKQLLLFFYKNVFIRITLVSSLCIYAIYAIYNLCCWLIEYNQRRRILLDIQSFKINNNAKKIDKNSVITNTSTDNNIKNNQNKENNTENGIYNNYEYYYKDNQDRYAEPYTSKPNIQTMVNDFETKVDKKINEIEEQATTASNMNTSLGKEVSDKLNDLAKNLEEQKQQVKENDINEFEKQIEKLDEKYEEQKNKISNQKDENEIKDILEINANDNKAKNESQHDSTNQSITIYNTEKKDIAFNENVDFNIVQFEENIIDKVRTMIAENNENIDAKFNAIRNDMGSIKDGVQGMVDRMTKAFELLAVALQGNKQ